jgi:DNA-binding NarL/FixJ family response regulator
MYLMTALPLPPHISRKHRIFLVEDHPIVREGVAQLINDEPDMLVCGQSDDIDGTLREIERAAPDVVVVDLLLGEFDGLDLVRELKARHPHVRTLVLSMYKESLYAERSLRAGARGYVTKLAPTETVLTAIRRVLSGGIYVSERMTSTLLSKLTGGGDAGADPADDLRRVSDREFEVFRLIGQSLGPTQIAERLGVSVKTVETYKDNLKRKLGLETGRDLLRRALEHAMEEGVARGPSGELTTRPPNPMARRRSPRDPGNP